MYYSQKNKKFKDPRYFLFEDEEKPLGTTTDATNTKPATPTTSVSGSVAGQPQGAKEVQIGIASAFIEPGAADVIEQPYLSGSNMAAEPGAAGVIARARGPIGKNWTYSLTAYGGKDQGGLKDPKPDPDKIVPEQPGAFCDCTGYVSWAAGFWQKRAPFANGMTSNLGTPASNPMPGDIAYRGAPPGGKHGHVGIVTAVNPEGATTEDINNGKADVDIVHCSSRKPAGGAVVEDKNAIKNGWAGRGEGRAKVMFYRPTSLLNSPNASKCPSCPKKGEDKAKAVAGQETQQGATPASAQPKPAGEGKKWWQFWKESIDNSSENLLIEEKNIMRHNTWDKMMYRLLSEQAEKRRIAEKAFAGKKELDNDEDGVPKWADKDDKNPKVGSKGSKSKAKKGKGKIPPQLKMHIQKKKKSKLDESIERLERILINEATVSDFKKFPINIVHERGKEAYQDSIVAIVSFEFPGTPIRTSDFGPDQAPNVEKVPLLKRFMDKKRSGEFKSKYDTRESEAYQYWLEEMLELPKKIHPEAEIYFDDSGARGSCEIVFDTEDKASFMEFASKLSEMTEELDELGGYDVLVYSGKLKHRNGQDFVPYQGKRYRIKDNLLQNLDKDLPDDEEVGISAPGAVAGGQVAESIRRLKRLLKEYEALEEYGEDRNPPMEEEDDDFDADELPEYSEEDFGDYGEESMKKFAQKSKAFADKYTEEDEYEETEETCPECGSDEFDGEHCDECGHEESDEDDMDDDLEDDDLEDDDLEDDDLEDDDELYEAEEQYLSEAQVKKKQPRLGKVTRNPSGSKKKFHVYVKCGGRVKKISFGDPGLSIKRDSAARRKNFRARHKCDKPAGKDRCTARYWSCYQWRAGKKVEGEE